jgi:hypothetical protein
VTWSFTTWSPDDGPGEVHDSSQPQVWDKLTADYTNGNGNPALERIFEIARQHGVVSVVREYRYIDADWRSQHAHFYNGTFRRYPSVCHRLHFFTRPVPTDLAELGNLQDAYRGYTVLRPLPMSPVGRTMIAAPPELLEGVRCEGDDTIDLFGWRLQIRAMPFISQDAQYLRCAHAALWMVLAHARFVHGLPRRLPAEVHEAALGGVIVGRQLPSDGLSGQQMLGGLTALGLSPSILSLPADRAADASAGHLSLHGVLCRYINSAMPPIVTSQVHAWVVTAYLRKPSQGHGAIQLWRHDDVRGPYLPVGDPWNEPDPAHQPWSAAYLPLLPKAYLDAERAEAVGRSWVAAFASTAHYRGTTLEQADLRPTPEEQRTLRTYLVDSRAYKQRLKEREVPAALAAAYRLTFMPRYIWVVEIVDRQRRHAGQPDVLGEVILDSTMTQHAPLSDPGVVALHADRFAYLPGIDHGGVTLPDVPAGIAYSSGCPNLRG